jgi:hypothetical protein
VLPIDLTLRLRAVGGLIIELANGAVRTRFSNVGVLAHRSQLPGV